MENNNVEQPNSVLPPTVEGAPTIGAKPINPQTVVSPIRYRFRGSQIIWYIAGLIEILLILRFFMKLIGANASAGFTQFVYGVSGPFAGGFTNVVTPSQVATSVFDWSILLAMAIYGLVAWGAVKLLVMSKPISDQDAHAKLDSQE